MNVLVVDDDADLLRLVAASVKRVQSGITVHTQSDGLKAIETMRSLNFDFVVCDVMMPALDGARLCETLAADQQLRAVPVVLLTTIESDALASVLRLPNVRGYIQKPISVPALRDRLSELFAASH